MSRRTASELVATVEADLERLNEFSEAWEHVNQTAFESLSADQITNEEIVAFDEDRKSVARMYEGVRSLLGEHAYVRKSMGVEIPLDPFGYLLSNVAHLGTFHSFLHGNVGKELFFETRTRSRAIIAQTQGRLDHQITDLRAGPEIVDDLVELAARLECSVFVRHIETAETDIADNEPEEAIHACRRALERLVTELANRIAKDARQRKFSEALATLRDHGLVPGSLHKALATPTVGMWGWLSEVGTHDEHSPNSGEEEVVLADGELALQQVRSVCLYLLKRYESVRATDS